jgi:hypothetical protein
MLEVEKELGHVDLIAELLHFIRTSARGINTMRKRSNREAA